MLRVSAAIINNSDNEILICQRGPGGSCEFLWEFPGGKIEPGESPEECVVRECREELGIDIEVQDLFEQMTYPYPEREIEFLFFRASMTDGVPLASEHQWGQTYTFDKMWIIDRVANLGKMIER